MFQTQEEETHILCLQSMPTGCYVKESGGHLQTMETDVDIKPDATELLRASLSRCESINNSSTHLDNIRKDVHIKQEKLLLNFESSISNVKGRIEDKKVDIFAVTKEEPSFGLASASETVSYGNNINIISGERYLQPEEYSSTQNYGEVMKTQSTVYEYAAQPLHGLKNKCEDIEKFNEQKDALASIVPSSHTSRKTAPNVSVKLESGLKVNPIIDLCKISITFFDKDGRLKIPIQSKAMPAYKCWVGVKESSPFVKKCSELRHASVSAITRTKEKLGLSTEKTTCPVFDLSAVNQLVSGCPEIENNIADMSSYSQHSLSLSTSSSFAPATDGNDTEIRTIENQDDTLRLTYSVLHNSQSKCSTCIDDVQYFKRGGSSTPCYACHKISKTIEGFNKEKKRRKEGPYNCNECGKSFNQNCYLKKHMMTHTGEKPYNCIVCDKNFSKISYLKTHQKETHTEEEAHKCNVCGKEFARMRYLKRHMRIHTGEKPYKCNDCGKSFTQSGGLQAHLGTHTGEKPYKCNDCGKEFALIKYLKNHKRTHNGEKPHKCNDCGKEFAVLSYLKMHMMTHTGEKPYKCNDCGKEFALMSYLKTHTKIHTGEKPYKCNECGKQFAIIKSLKNHIRTHTGVKPYKCNDCGKEFPVINSLKNHMKTHTGEKSYNCNDCGKEFALMSYLKIHMRTHTEEKPYKCNYCGKQFAVMSYLKIHMRTHTGEKSYDCGKSFTINTALRDHIRTHILEKSQTNAMIVRRVLPNSVIKKIT